MQGHRTREEGPEGLYRINSLIAEVPSGAKILGSQDHLGEPSGEESLHLRLVFLHLYIVPLNYLVFQRNHYLHVKN